MNSVNLGPGSQIQYFDANGKPWNKEQSTSIGDLSLQVQMPNGLWRGTDRVFSGETYRLVKMVEANPLFETHFERRRIYDYDQRQITQTDKQVSQNKYSKINDTLVIIFGFSFVIAFIIFVLSIWRFKS